MMNKKGQVSRTVILISLVVISLFMNLFYTAYVNTKTDMNDGVTSDVPSGIQTSDNSNVVTQHIGIGDFLASFILGFQEAPLWLNIIFLIINYVAIFLLVTMFIPLINAGN